MPVLPPSSPISIGISLQQPQLPGPQNTYQPNTADSRDTPGKGSRGVSLLAWQGPGMEDSAGHLHPLGEHSSPGHGSHAWPVQRKVTPRPVNPGRHRGDLLVTQLLYYVELIKKKKEGGRKGLKFS